MQLHSSFARSTVWVFGLALLVPLSAEAQGNIVSTDLTNIAAAANGGRVLTSTSTFQNDASYSANNLIDGQVWNAARSGSSHGWASDRYDPISMESVTFGFAGKRTYKIGKIVLNPTTDLPPERWAKDVEVQVSKTTAEGPYIPVAQLTLSQKPEPQEFLILPVEARFVRLAFRTNYGSDRAIALGEVEMYEAIGKTDPMGVVINQFESAIKDLSSYRQGVQNGTLATAGADGGNGVATSSAPGKVDIVAAKNGGRVLAYSSTYNNDSQFGPDKLIDGQVFSLADGKGSAGWASQGFESGKEYVTLGFANDATHLIGKVVLNPASNQSDLRWARRVDVQITTGDFKTGPWNTVATANLKPAAANQEFNFRSAEAKYVRFVFLANGPGVVLPNGDPNVNSDRAVSLGEIEVYEAPSGNDELSILISKFNSALTQLKTVRRTNIVTTSDNPNTDSGVTTALASLPDAPDASDAAEPTAAEDVTVAEAPAAETAPTTVVAVAAPVKASSEIPKFVAKPKVGN